MILLDGDFVTNLCYTGRPSLKKKKKALDESYGYAGVCPDCHSEAGSRGRESNEAAMGRAGLTVLTC